MGLGLHVVLTCNESHMGHFLVCDPDSATPPVAQSAPWFKQVSDHAFDIRQYPITTWTNPTHLAKALKDRIDALGLALTRRE